MHFRGGMGRPSAAPVVCASAVAAADTAAAVDTAATIAREEEREPFLTKRSEVVKEVIPYITQWLDESDNNRVNLIVDAMFGYEGICNQIYDEIKIKVNVEEDKWQIYRRAAHKRPYYPLSKKTTVITTWRTGKNIYTMIQLCICYHGEDRPEDTVEHTVAECPAWAEHRRALREVIGDGDLSRPGLVQAMMQSEGDWDAVSSFCDAVMLAKEEAGRVRQRFAASLQPSHREGHTGRRGSRDDLRPPQFPKQIYGVTNEESRIALKKREDKPPPPDTLDVQFSVWLRTIPTNLDEEFIRVYKFYRLYRIEVDYSAQSGRDDIMQFINYLKPNQIKGFPRHYITHNYLDVYSFLTGEKSDANENFEILPKRRRIIGRKNDKGNCQGHDIVTRKLSEVLDW
ncbi:unnamed protein product [Spodoptera littoralis]|uniref:Uncharacterized protein n=1 Tax=Spodoptera littoralis TaxID=7109 RepID=A0A9P0N7Q6_SPOLI|nr:unnamed protein product [Spodoptera littoralis]CAH1642831.1 unnamed protein product [Spodoptera littoralis]